MPLTRRAFIAGTLIAGCGASAARRLQAASPLGPQGLDAFGGSEPPCGPEATITPGVPVDGTFRAGAPLRASLAPAGFKGESIAVSGTVSGTKCGRIKGARLDFWQADAQGKYDPTGFTLRGHQLTDAAGRYSLFTPIPGASPGRAPHLSIRVSIAGKPDFYTESFLPGDPRNATDARFKPALAMKKTASGFIFDVTLNM
jgi:protocatechuate 3,4-dioxygenase beta subunit